MIKKFAVVYFVLQLLFSFAISPLVKKRDVFPFFSFSYFTEVKTKGKILIAKDKNANRLPLIHKTNSLSENYRHKRRKMTNGDARKYFKNFNNDSQLEWIEIDYINEFNKRKENE